MVISKKLFIQVVIILLISSCNITNKRTNVLTGADVIIKEKLHLLKSKKLGIVTNHSAVLKNGTHLVDTLNNIAGIKIVKLFGPEHGIRGKAPDGETINDMIDKKTGIPIFSLYGKNKKPTSEMLTNIDVLLYDIQDIGARFYTYISTLYYVIEAAAKYNIPLIILDRPNPIGGKIVNGPILKKEFISFVGIEELPIRHGMTIGELALFFYHQIKIKQNHSADLTIVKMKNWKRNYFFDDCELKWINPSPNIPDFETALAYPGLCLLEGTNISEGRGTYKPFLTFGSPFLNNDSLFSELTKLDLDAIEFTKTSFKPVAIKGMSNYPKYENQKCNGITIKVLDKKYFNSIDFAINLIYLFNKLHPHKFEFRANWIDKLWGSSNLREAILSNKTPQEIIDDYQSDLNNFKIFRKQFLLY